MAKQTGWIVGALAAALWVAPAVAQTGATSDSARAGTGAGTTAPTGSGMQGVPSGSTNDPSAKGASGRSVEGQSGRASSDSSGTGSTSGIGSSGTGSDTSATPRTSTAPPTSTSDASRSETEQPGRPSNDGSSMGTSAGGTSTRHSAAEAETLQKLHAGNQAEIQAGQWMQEHAQNSKVKDFAKKMVKDHKDMDKDVQQFAQKQGISLTGGASSDPEAAKDQQHMHMMQQMPAGQADRHYMTMMVNDHQRDVSEVRSAAQQAKSSDDKDFAKLLDKSAKKMEDHLKDAQKIQRDMGSRQARTPGQQ